MKQSLAVVHVFGYAKKLCYGEWLIAVMIGLYLFLQRTQRIPKEVCNATKNPEEFAKILIERLEKVKIQREQGEREAHNLAIHCEVWLNVTVLHEIRFFIMCLVQI